MFTFEELESDNWCELCERTMANDSVRHIIDNHAYCGTCGPQVHLVKRAQLNLGCGCFEYDRNLGDYIPAAKCLGKCSTEYRWGQ